MPKKLVLLHGALGAGVQLEPLAALLSKEYEVSIYEFPGHGKGAGEKDGFPSKPWRPLFTSGSNNVTRNLFWFLDTAWADM